MPKVKPVPPTPSPNVPRSRWIGLSAAVDYSGLSKKTLWRRIEDGTLRAYKVAGTRTVRVAVADLDAMFTPINGA